MYDFTVLREEFMKKILFFLAKLICQFFNRFFRIINKDRDLQNFEKVFRRYTMYTVH